jgi:hypothetical protein
MIAHYRIARPIPDNDENYFSLLEGVLSSIDSLCQMDVQKGFEAYHFRILPSDGRLVDNVVQELITLHNMLGIHMEMSKSIKNMGVISFQIKINQ